MKRTGRASHGREAGNRIPASELGEGAEDLRSGRQEVEEGAGGPRRREGERGLGGTGRPAALWPSPFQARAVRSLAGTAVLRYSDLPGGQKEPPWPQQIPQGGADF